MPKKMKLYTGFAIVSSFYQSDIFSWQSLSKFRSLVITFRKFLMPSDYTSMWLLDSISFETYLLSVYHAVN